MYQGRMVELLNSLVPEEKVISLLDNKIDLFRISNSSPRTPLIYEPRIFILAQGQKKIFIGSDEYCYDSMNYLVSSVPLPLECETTAAPEKPMLGLSIYVDPVTIGELLLEMDENVKLNTTIPKGIFASALTNDLINATIRLLEALSSEKDKIVLAPMFVKEIIYRVLRDENGAALRALAYRNQRFFQIARILNKIHESYSEEFNLSALALEAGMSVSTFHSSFKSVTNISPLQYIKNVRLTKARLLMLQEGINAHTAALHVGYESPSQFSREYKRFFGVTPGKDVAQPVRISS